MRRRNTESLQQVLRQVLHEHHLDTKLNETRLISLWPDIVGKDLAAKTDNLFIRQKTLCLHVKSAIVRYELLQMRASLIKKLNEAIGEEVIDNISLH